MKKERVPFIDFMKAFGILIIVIGHLGLYLADILKVVYFKQLGVALFIFIAGYGLAKTKHTGLSLIIRRLFKLYFWGILIAIIISAVKYFTIKDLLLSNYTPFVLGLNTFFNYFPANPTTWYIGTYTHIMVLAALFIQRLKVSGRLLISILVVETLVRAYLMNIGLYIAYMSVFNWLFLLFLGVYLGQKKVKDITELKNEAMLAGSVATLVALLAVLWSFSTTQGMLRVVQIFSHPLTDQILSSLSVTLIYTLATIIVFQFSLRLKASKTVQIISDNTLVIFIAHMPIIYAIEHISLGNMLLTKTFFFIMAFILPLIISMVVTRIIDVGRIMDYLLQKISR